MLNTRTKDIKNNNKEKREKNLSIYVETKTRNISPLRC